LPDGSPHSVPLWVGLEGERIVFLTGPRSRKARNIEGDPRVAISVTDRDQPFNMAMVRGRVVDRIDGDAAWAIIDRLSVKYTGGPYPERTGRVIFVAQPEHVSATSF
jgi:PPOX class probable F420-dependent enzyme